MKNAVILGDIHAPFHNRRALELVSGIVEDIRPDYVISVGDFLDCYAVSKYPKSRDRRLDIGWEITSGLEVAKQLRACSPKSHFRITLGNHEARTIKYIDEHPELEGLSVLNLRQGFIDAGWFVTDYGSSFSLGKILISHDFGRAGLSAVRQAVIDVGYNCVFGHTHRAGLVYQPTLHGDTHVAMNVGWLGDTSYLDYGHRDRAKRDSVLGIGFIQLDDDGCFVANFHPFISANNKLKTCVGGYWYEV